MRFIKLGMLAATGLVALSTGGADAADLSAYRAPLPAATAYSWTGLYVGANIGYGWGDARYEADVVGGGGASQSDQMNGVIGGLQSGYNHQFGNWVLGFESDIQLSAQEGGSTFPGGFGVATITTDHKLTWFGTSRTRLGFLMTPMMLLYGTAGVAYGQVKEDTVVDAPGPPVFNASFSDVKAGWTAGGGIEAAFGAGWSAKLEYLYMDLGKTEHTFGTVALGTIRTETRSTIDNIVRVGLNYRWGG